MNTFVILLVILICASLGAVWAACWLWWTLQTGAPLVGSRGPIVRALLACIPPKHAKGSLVDLGAGYGAIVQAARRAGYTATGYELNPVAAWWAGPHVQRADAFSAEILNTDVVTTYLLPGLMHRIESEMYPQMKAGSILIARDFPLPNITPSHTKKAAGATFYLYIR